MEPRDTPLARAAARGERDARRALADRLLDRVRATIGYLTGGDQDLDDMVQMAMVEILRSAHTYEGKGKMTAWADRIAVRTAMRMLKKRSSRERPSPVEDTASMADTMAGQEMDPGALLSCPVLPSADESQETRLARTQLRRCLSDQLQKLNDHQRTAVVLRWAYGYRVKEIAEITETPVNTVRDRLQTGRRKLAGLAARDPVLRDWRPRGST